MYKILIFLYLSCVNSLLIFNKFSKFNNNNNNLPPIGEIYTTNLNIPFLGKQNIEYIRTENLKSLVILNGIINNKGYIYFNESNVYDYKLDSNLTTILSKYKCNIIDPNYDNTKNIITLDLKINIVKYTKTLILKSKINSDNIDFSCQ